MISPGSRHHEDHGQDHKRHPSKADRWLVGLVAGAALMYLLGKALGLGKSSAKVAPRPPQH